MLASLAIIAIAISGGLWRRVDGGWLGLPRSICFALGAVLVMIPSISAAYSLCPHWSGAITLGVLASALVMLFFVMSLHPGPSFTNMEVFKKYGPFGLGYWLARLYWPESWRVGGFIDGPYAVGEIFLGTSVYGALAAACWGYAPLVRAW